MFNFSSKSRITGNQFSVTAGNPLSSRYSLSETVLNNRLYICVIDERDKQIIRSETYYCVIFFNFTSYDFLVLYLIFMCMD